MLKLLSKLAGRDLTALREPILEEKERLSDEQIVEEYFPISPVSKQEKEALGRFVALITAQLGVEESQRLTQLVLSHLGPADSASDAFLSGIRDDDGQRRGKWVMLQVDCKGTDEVEWQANEILSAAGVTEIWHLQGRERVTVPQALLEFSSWVKKRGFRLLHLDFNCDSFFALLVSVDKLEEILRAAEEAGLELQESDQFEIEQARD